MAATVGLAVLSDRATGARGAAADGVEPFSQVCLETRRESGRTVFVDMTAAWRITCQVNERTVLYAGL